MGVSAAPHSPYSGWLPPGLEPKTEAGDPVDSRTNQLSHYTSPLSTLFIFLFLPLKDFSHCNPAAAPRIAATWKTPVADPRAWGQSAR